MDSRAYWIWLAQLLGPGNRAIQPLVAAFGVASAVYEAEASALKQIGLPAVALRRLKRRSPDDLEAARRLLDDTLRRGDWVLTPEDDLYPTGLRRLEDMPAALYCRGTMPRLEERPAVAVVGTRHPSPAGEQAAYAMAAGLAASGMVVVSGGAVGIDTAAHNGALMAQGTTALVMACPLSVEYPAENTALRQRIVDNGGVLISEYPDREPYHCVFPIRNRLLVGLSQGVCLAETPARSGARITARLARENGRDVFAMPGSLQGHRNDGAHEEIRQGAVLVTGAADIVTEYMTVYPGVLDASAATAMQKQAENRPEQPVPVKPKPTPRPKTELPVPARETPVLLPDEVSDAARAVYALLTDTPIPVDELAQAAGMSIPPLLAALTELEMVGCAANHAGQQYCRL
ncbi:MAG: DNA-protecting protein DprA [Ruminococcaceae bacterium]|nr:DNA-protecting protein DprA [Oscillospiraceae bacterium]